MKLQELNEGIVEKEYWYLAECLVEAQKGNNTTVAKWSDCLGMSYNELHEIWEKAESKAPGKYGIIMTIFKRMLTSIKGITKTQLKSCASQKGGSVKVDNYKIRTKQSKTELLDDKPAPKNTNRAFVKKQKSKVTKINQQMRDIKAKPNNTPARKARNKKQLEELRAKKKEIQNSLK